MSERAGDGAAMIPPAPPTQPEVERVDVHRECLGCGYDLWDQPVKGVCSECGREVRLTLATPVWVWNKPDDAARFARGLRLMARAILAAGCVLVLMALGAILSGGNSDIVPLVGISILMCVLAAYVTGLVRAAGGAPAVRALGFLSAGLMSVFIAGVVGVLLQAAGIMARPNVPEERYVQVIGGAMVGQGVTLGLWLCLNNEVVSSRKRSEWMMWCGMIGSVIAGSVGVLILAVSAGLERAVRPGSPLFVAYLLLVWGMVLAGVAWSTWAPFLWLRIARRVDQLRAAKNKPKTGATTH